MKDLPVPDPGEPDRRSANRYLAWLARSQASSLAGGIFFGIGWMLSAALMPAAIGWAVDAIATKDQPALFRAAAALFGLGLAGAGLGTMRHRMAVTNWLAAAYRTVQVTVAHTTKLGATLPKRVAAGEVVSIGTADITAIGEFMDIIARGSGAIVAIVTVAALLLSASLPLGLGVAIGVPVLMALVGLLMRPLHRRTEHYRGLTGELTNHAGDIVAGLRILRGIGGEAAFVARYRDRSQTVRDAGVAVGRVQSLLRAAEVLLPGTLVVLVTWIGARFALAGQISPGELVAFFGYATFLLLPLRTLTEAADKLTRGHVAARRVVRVLRLEPEFTDPPEPAPEPPADGALEDPDSGVRIEPGRYTAIAAVESADAVAIADRLGRYDPAGRATLAGVPLAGLRLNAVRMRILVTDNDARLFNGPLRDTVGDPAAVATASAGDIVDGLPDGLDTALSERGREFSGGQQQRLRLARALAADPPVLVLVEPTSAVDAHTEARIAARIAGHRRGRTTVVCTTSPLVLDHADHVIFVADGRAVAEGRHRDLLNRVPAYRAAVTRDEDD